MDWETLNPALLDLFEALARPTPGAPGPTVEHQDRPRKMISATVKQALKVRVLSVRGLDAEAVLEFDEETEEQTEVVRANRIATYRLTCDAVTNTDKSWAWSTIERIRLRLRRSRSLDALAVLNATLLRCLPSQEANFRADGHMYSRVFMDVQLLVHVREADPEPSDWIQSVVISSEHIKDSDGTNLPEPLQMVDVLVDSAADPP